MRDASSIYRALFLLLGCICFRLLSGSYPSLLPNISPMIAVALVGAMVLPRSWGWLMGPSALAVTDLAFLATNYRAEGTTFTWSSVVFLLFFALVGGLGALLGRGKSLFKIIAASLLSSLSFYLLANTLAWWSYSLPAVTPSYPPTLAGWWQANTVGLPGWAPSWTFLRNGMLGDLFFVFVLLLILDREQLMSFFRAGARTPVTSSAA